MAPTSAPASPRFALGELAQAMNKGTRNRATLRLVFIVVLLSRGHA
jgi:hypothetical protein